MPQVCWWLLVHWELCGSAVEVLRVRWVITRWCIIINICLRWDQSLWSHGDHFKVGLCSCPASFAKTFISLFVPITCISNKPPQYRWSVYGGIRGAIDANEGGMNNFTQGRRLINLVATLIHAHVPPIVGSVFILLLFILSAAAHTCPLRIQASTRTQAPSI